MQGHKRHPMTPVEVDVFAAATGADEMPLRQAEFMSALIAGTGQGRAGKRKLCALGKGPFRQQFKAGGNGQSRFYESDGEQGIKNSDGFRLCAV